jgi:hypothetical protein
MSNQLALQSFDELSRAAQAVADSKLFGVNTPEQAIALFLIAQSEGRHPASAAKEYHIIKGRPSLRADAILARFQQAGGSVRWGERTDTSVSATFSHPQGGDVEIRWTLEDAKRAGLASGEAWKKYPRHLLSARVISEGVRLCYAPVVCGLYTPEEVEQFDTAPAAKKPAFAKRPVVEAEPVEVEEATAAPAPAPAPAPKQTEKTRIAALCSAAGITEDDILSFLEFKGLLKSEKTLWEFSEKIIARVESGFPTIAAWVQQGGAE